MIATWKKIFTTKETRNKVFYTLAMLLVYRFGAALPAPNINQGALTSVNLGFLDMMNLLGGGQLQQFSIFALGVGPYITASIVIQLLAMDVIPYLSDLQKEGQQGKMKLDRITRYLAVILAFVQSLSMIYVFDNQYSILLNDSTANYFYTSIVMTAGTMFLLWIGDRISKHGIGNGTSMIIFAGIVSGLPNTFVTAFATLVGAGSSWVGILEFIGFILVYVAIILLVIYMNQAERRIPIQYTSSSLVQRKSEKNYLPLKINSASVIPVIFASSIMTAPVTILSFVNQGEFFQTLSRVLSLQSWSGLLIYSVLIIFFTFFYTHLTVDPEKIADNLSKNGTYVTSIRPGEATKKYISTVLNRITVLGAAFLLLVALLPHVIPLVTDLPASISVGGTGLIIVVGVALETMKTLESQVNQRQYQGFKKAK
ncbi:MAG: preprotein translocase subunit SecY [Erysipelothrix sp.]|nr:preprotein translocase subunit SecY [Erysipelothrix sp.]